MIIKGLRWGNDPEAGEGLDEATVELELEDHNTPLYVLVSYFDTWYTAVVHNEPLFDRFMDLDTPDDAILNVSFRKGDELDLEDQKYAAPIEACLDCLEVYKEGEWASAEEFIEPYIGMEVEEADLCSGEDNDSLKMYELLTILENSCWDIYRKMKVAYGGEEKCLTIKISTEGKIDVVDEDGNVVLSRKNKGRK